MNQALINRYRELTCSGIEPFNTQPYPEDLFFTDKQVVSAMIRVPQHKALTTDCVPDSIFRICCKSNESSRCYEDARKIMLAKQCFTQEFWDKSSAKIHLTGRVIPLNKASPATPKSTQIRFIIAISPVQKLQEASITPFLMKYAIENLSDKQRGFIAEMTTHQNIVDILDPDNKGKDILLIDFASAFDTIDRRRLYDVIVTRNVLPPDMMKLLLFIHTNSRVQLGAYTMQTLKGVPQGSLMSPLLFNIYIAELLDLMSNYGLTKAFADDIGIAISKDKNTEDAIDLVVN